MKMPPDLESLKKSPELLKKEINELECNMSIDNARLLEVRAVCNKIRDLQGSIKTAYDTYQSPSLIDVRRSTGQEADPVTKAFHELENLYNSLCECYEMLDRFENDLQKEIKDPELRAIIRARYIMGDSWKKCTKRIMNLNNSEAAKYRVYRYLDTKK